MKARPYLLMKQIFLLGLKKENEEDNKNNLFLKFANTHSKILLKNLILLPDTFKNNHDFPNKVATLLESRLEGKEKTLKNMSKVRKFFTKPSRATEIEICRSLITIIQSESDCRDQLLALKKQFPNLGGHKYLKKTLHAIESIQPDNAEDLSPSSSTTSLIARL